MKKFKFRLEKVLQYRVMLKEERLRELNVAFRNLREAEEQLAHLNEEFLRIRIEDGEILMVEQVQARASYSERLKGEIANLKIRITELQEAAEVARQAYVDATQEAQVLEKLKDKKHEVFKEMVEKHEANFLDELTTQKGNTVSIQKR